MLHEVVNAVLIKIYMVTGIASHLEYDQIIIWSNDSWQFDTSVVGCSVLNQLPASVT